MHFLIGTAVVAGAVWLAIEFPKFRKALLITGVLLALFIVWAGWFMSKAP
jgi:hypothetical protein